MYRQVKSSNKFKAVTRICVYCNKEFISLTHGGTKQYCSYSCSNKHKWESRKLKPKKLVTRVCVVCNVEFKKNPKLSISQWSQNKFCSQKCAMENRKINDGMTRAERSRRKKGILVRGSIEWQKHLKESTIVAMARPEVKEKLSKPKGKWSDDRKATLSDKLKGIMPKNVISGIGNGSFPNVQRGDYECSKGTVYFRSKWEANYALLLDFLLNNGDIQKWEYEPDKFIFHEIKFGTRSYLPDFKLFNNDNSVEYHEVKGYMDSKSKTKLKRMDKYYPEVKVKLIDKNSYRDILKKMKGIIKFY